MLNGRLYLHAWFIATVALLVAFLTLQPVEEISEGEQAAIFNAGETSQLATQFQQTAPLRVPGTVGAAAGEQWVTQQFQSLPESDKRVAIQRAVVRRGDDTTPIVNVLFTVPAKAATKSQRNILVVAPRDAPRQVSGGASGTAMLVELARLSIRASYHHPMIFLSVDGDTRGNAGLRWYLASVDTKRIAGVIVLDGPGEGQGNMLHLWASGDGRQALDMRRLAAQAVSQAGFVPEPQPTLRQQLIRLAVTQTFGAQRAAIDRGVPAVTLSARNEATLPTGVPPINIDYLKGAGNAALNLITILDAKERANAPDGALAYAGRILRPSVARLALLFLALPLFVLALDAAARIRRARVRLSAGLRAVAWRTAPVFVGLGLARLLVAFGVLRAPDVGRPPPALELPFDGQAVLASLLVVLSAAAVWMVVRPRVAATGANPPAEAAGALLVLSGVVLAAWVFVPFALVVILPAAHAALAAIVAPRVWQLVLLAIAALMAPLAVLVHIGHVIDRGAIFAGWYLLQTTAAGARGVAGPIIAVVAIVAIGSLVALVAFRIRKGLVTSGDVRQGLGWLASNLSARKRRGGGSDGDTTQKT